MCASTTSREETSPSRIARARAVAERCVSAGSRTMRPYRSRAGRTASQRRANRHADREAAIGTALKRSHVIVRIRGEGFRRVAPGTPVEALGGRRTEVLQRLEQHPGAQPRTLGHVRAGAALGELV